MKRILGIIAAIIFPVAAMAQPFVRNDEAADGSYPVGSGDHYNSAASVDEYGRIFLSPSSPPISISASTPIPVTINSSQLPLDVLQNGSIPMSDAGSDGTNQYGVPVAPGFQQFIAAKTATSSTGSSPPYAVNCTSHGARVGDIITFTSGTAGNVGVWRVVGSVPSADQFLVFPAWPTAPQINDGFNIYRVSLARSEMTPAAMITILPTAVPTAYSTPQFANTAPLRSLTVDNGNGDAEIWCAYGGSTTTHFRVLPGKTFFKNFGADGEVFSGAVGCIHPAATPSTGTIAIYGAR